MMVLLTGSRADAYKQQAALETANDNSAAAELNGYCDRFNGFGSPTGATSRGGWIPSDSTIIVNIVIIIGVFVSAQRRHGRAGCGLGCVGARQGRRHGDRRRGMYGEEGRGNGGVGAEKRDGMRAGVGEELAVGGGQQQRGQLRRLVGVEEGREALGEEERRRGAWDSHWRFRGMGAGGVGCKKHGAIRALRGASAVKLLACRLDRRIPLGVCRRHAATEASQAACARQIA